MRDHFDWAEEQRCTVIDAEKLFEKRRQEAVTRLIFGPPLPRLDGVILPYRSRNQASADAGKAGADDARAAQ